ncbi:MAG: hypothetical protein IJR13_07445 [Bacteroidales bacterium]|nr:hypothetical protein [Bacteroidales bacterium]
MVWTAKRAMKMTVKQFFQQDKAMVGVVAVVASELLAVVLLTVVLLIVGESPMAHIRWYAGVAVPALLVVRAYAKYRDALSATKGAIVALAVTFVLFMLFLIKTKTI